MNSALAKQIGGGRPQSVATPVLSPTLAVMEGAYLANVLNLLMCQAWLRTIADTMALGHNMALASMGIHPSTHVAPWDDLATSTGATWFEAMDKVLKAMGD
ncbi:MAG TPA: hypothetical protein VF898_14685 [Chloroflexota bacterium]